MPARRDRDLMSWWKRFQTKGGNKKEEGKGKASFLPGTVTRDNASRSLSHLSLSSSSLPQPQPPFLYTPNSSSLSADSSVSPHPFLGDGGRDAHGGDRAPLEPTPPTSSGGHSGSEGISTSDNRRRSLFNPLKRRRASAVPRTEIIANAKGPHQRRSAGSLVGPLRSSTWSSSVLATSQTPPENGDDSGATICATVVQVPSISTPATSPVVSTASPVSSSAPAVHHSPSLTVIRNAAARALNPSRWLSRPESRRSAHAFPAYRSPAHRGSLFIAEETGSAIFGIPLAESIKYANVAISLTDAEGKSFIYGYVPIVVAKCGVFLKEKATDVEGIFRLSGSAKRIKELQAVFDSPDRYGKGLDWTGYTVHDAANIFRRYLNLLPEPVVPLSFYDRFRDPLRNHECQAVGDLEAQGRDTGDFDEEGTIRLYQQLITELPPLSRQLLLYILDLLAVFASKSDVNRMSATNLSAIFQPGMLSHPTHDMAPPEYRLSQDVVVFLIEKQDHFLIGMSGTAADEATVQQVQSGGTPQATTPTTGGPPRPPPGLGRSSSSASAGAESVRRYGGRRRNMSVSSKHSRNSGRAPSTGSPVPASPKTVGVQRSNTLPSKKSPALPSGRFQKLTEVTPSSPGSAGPRSPLFTSTDSNSAYETVEPSQPSSAPLLSGSDAYRKDTGHARIQLPDSPSSVPQALRLVDDTSASHHHSIDAGSGLGVSLEDEPFTVNTHDSSAAQILPRQAALTAHDPTNLEPLLPTSQRHQIPTTTPNKERNFSNLFNRPSTSDSERKETRAPKKLRKKRVPGSGNVSGHSSTGSVHDDMPAITGP